jgi:hypothetical protein
MGETLALPAPANMVPTWPYSHTTRSRLNDTSLTAGRSVRLDIRLTAVTVPSAGTTIARSHEAGHTFSSYEQ